MKRFDSLRTGRSGIESQWGAARFSASVQTDPVAYPASYTIGTGSFPVVQAPGRGADFPPPSSAEVEERVVLYFYFPSGPSWPVLGDLYLYMFYHIAQREIKV